MRRSNGDRERWMWVSFIILVLSEFAMASPEKPEAVPDAGWLKMFAAQKAQLKEKLDLCFVGDSLTAYWLQAGRSVWELDFNSYKTANLGISGDRTEHILYRIERSNFQVAEPGFFVLMAGTNNLAKTPPDSPEATANGVAKIVESMKKKVPTSKVLVVSILPNGRDPESALRKQVVVANGLLARLRDEDGVEFLDVHDKFLNENGRWKRGLTLDGTHLSKSGYDLLARRLVPVVEKLLK